MSRKLVLIVASAILGCGAQKPANPNAGQIKISTGTNAHLASNDGTAPNVCGTFTLQPYSLDANGNQTLAGAAQTISSVPGSQTDAILGCIAGTGDATGQNWGYIVSATSFIDCSGDSTDPYNGIAIPGLSPSTVTGNYPVICKAGVDTSLAINVDVSIPEANGAGYIDISVGVDSTEVQAGCKQADIDSSGLLHFGQSYVQTTTGVTPSAYTGIGIYSGGSTGTAPASGSVQQFEGSVQSGAENDAYFTGLFQLPASSSSTTLVQAFAQPCATGQMTLQPNAVQCVTQATLPDSTTTSVQISDVFVQWPGDGAVSASITGANTITLYTSLGGPNLGTLSTGTMGYDALTSTQALVLADPAIGLYGSLVYRDQLNALVQDATLGPSLVVLALDESTGQWSAALPVALSTRSLAQQQALGLFGTGGCFAEPPSSVPPPTDLTYGTATLNCLAEAACALGGPTNTGGTATSYSISPALEAGLTFDPATGAISGTPPAQSAPAIYTVTATNAGGSTFTTVTITVAPVCDFTEWDVAAAGSGASWLSADSDGTIWFSEQVSNRLAHLNPASNLLTEWTLPGNTIDAWTYGVSADRAGRVYYAQSGDSGAPTSLSPNLIGLLDPAAATITQWDVAPVPSGAYLVDYSGAAWFTIYEAGQIARLDPTTNMLTRWNVGPANTNPEAIVEHGGLVYFSEDGFRTIAQLDPSTNVITSWPIPGGLGAFEPQIDISVDATGGIWFTTNEFDVAGRLDPATGTFQIWQEPSVDCPSGGCYPYGIEAAADGTVWMSDYVGRIWSFDVTSTPAQTTLVAPGTSNATFSSQLITPRVQAIAGTTQVAAPTLTSTPANASGEFLGCLVPNAGSEPGALVLDSSGQAWYGNYSAPAGLGRVVIH